MAVTLERSNYRYSGLSSDTKPTDVQGGTTFLEIDTGRTARWDGSQWRYQRDEEDQLELARAMLEEQRRTNELLTLIVESL